LKPCFENAAITSSGRQSHAIVVGQLPKPVDVKVGFAVLDCDGVRHMVEKRVAELFVVVTRVIGDPVGLRGVSAQRLRSRLGDVVRQAAVGHLGSGPEARQAGAAELD